MKDGRRKSAGHFLPVASLAITALLVAAVIGVDRGLIPSPFGEAKKGQAPDALAKLEPGSPKKTRSPLKKSKTQAKKSEIPKDGAEVDMGEVPARPGSSLGSNEPTVETKPEPPKSPERREYDQKLEQLDDTPKAHADLAAWAESKGLANEALDQWKAVRRLAPNDTVANQKLGGKKVNGLWKTEEELAQAQADKTWRPKLDVLHKRIDNRGPDAAAVAERALAELAEVTDPRASPMLWHVFGGHKNHHLIVANQLARIKAPQSSLPLVALAAYSPEPKAQRVAIEALKSRDPVEFAKPLIDMLGPKLRWHKATLPREPGEPERTALEIEDERVVRRFVYFAETAPADLSSGAFGDCSAMVRWANFGWTSEGKAMARQQNRENAAMAKQMAERQLQSDIAAVEDLNKVIEARNDRVRSILLETTGQDFRIDRDQWNRWIYARKGLKYAPPPQVAKLEFLDFVQPYFKPSFIAIPPTPT